MIDLKEVKRREALYKKLVELFAQYDLYQDAVVACFNPLDMYQFRSLCKDAPIVTCLLYCKGLLQWYHDEKSDEMRLPWLIDTAPVRYCMDEILTLIAPTLLASFLGVDLIGPDQLFLSQNLIETTHKRGLGVYAWVCNELHGKAFFSKLGAMVCTDFQSKDIPSSLPFTTSPLSTLATAA